MKRRYIVGGVLVLIVILIWIVAGERGQKGHPPANPAFPVVATAAIKGDMPIVLNGLGTVTPLATVTVKTRINGQITHINFKEGQTVEKGDFLIEIDPRPYRIALEQAEAQLAHDQALLKNAEIDLKRYTTLYKEDSIAEQQMATQAALVRQYQAMIKIDQAAIDTAKLNLVYCRITAPVGGRVGLRQVDEGNFVQASDANGLVIITQLTPITVIFTLPEDNLTALIKRLQSGAKLPVTAYDRSRSTKLQTGVLATLDNQIDTTTGTFKLRADFANTDQSLFPNQFVNAALLLDTRHDSIIVPVSAIQRGAPGTFVYIVKADRTVTVRPVTLGPGDGERVTITKGLAVGEQVVTDGADKLREGAAVALPNEKPATPGAGG